MSINTPTPDSKIKRAASACDRCRKRKSKCSGDNPCSYCKTHGVECLYTYVKKKRTVFKKTSRKPIEVEEYCNETSSVSITENSSISENGSINENNKSDNTNDMNENLSNLVKMVGTIYDKLASIDNKIERLNERVTRIENGKPDEEMEDVDNNPLTEKSTNERMIELVTSLNSSCFLSNKTIEFVKEKTGENFKIFHPFIENHVVFLENLAHTIKYEFNDLKNFDDFLFEKPQSVLYFIKIFLRLHTKSFLIPDDQVCLTYTRFYATYKKSHLRNDLERCYNLNLADKTGVKFKDLKPLNDSEHLIFSTMICHGCSYICSKLHELSNFKNNNKNGKSNKNHKSTCEIKPHQTIFDDKVIVSAPRSVIEEIETKSMKNCFYYFGKIIDKSEGKESVIGCLLLYLYLSSTIYYKFNYFIINITIKHCQNLGYDKLNISKVETKDDYDKVLKKMLWFKTFIFDRDIAVSTEKPPHIKSNNVTNGSEFLLITKYCIKQYLKDEENKVYLGKLLSEINCDWNGDICNSKKFFEILHIFAQYSFYGFTLLIYFTAFRTSKLVTKFSKETYLNNIIKTIPKINDNDDQSSLSKLLKSIDKIKSLKQEYESWKDDIPENIRPGNNSIDISMYKFKDSDEGHLTNYFIKKKNDFNEEFYSVNPQQVIFEFDGYSTGELNESSDMIAALLYIVHFKCDYHIMKIHRLAYQTCLLIYNDDKLMKFFEKNSRVAISNLKKSFRKRISNYRSTALNSARDILKLSITVFQNQYHAITWCLSYITGSYFVLFVENVDYNILCNSKEEQEFSKREKLQDIYLMINCLENCLCNTYYPTGTLKSGEKDTFVRVLILVSIANFKTKYNYNVGNDSTLQNFIISTENLNKNEKENEKEKDPMVSTPKNSVNNHKFFDTYYNNDIAGLKNQYFSLFNNHNKFTPTLGNIYKNDLDPNPHIEGQQIYKMINSNHNNDIHSLFSSASPNSSKEINNTYENLTNDDLSNDLMLNLLELDPFSMPGYIWN